MNKNTTVTEASFPEAVRPAGAPAAAEASSLKCIFQKGTDVTWGWGLNSDKSYFQMRGSWTTTPYTKLEKFFTSTSTADMAAAAEAAKVYYGLVGYDLIGYCAATKASGYTYPIVAGGTELFPSL